jgi:hypothetical protein
LPLKAVEVLLARTYLRSSGSERAWIPLDADENEEFMRVFGIGPSRTGTTSLCVALETLGYRPSHFPKLSFFFGRLRIHPREFELHDAMCDLPVAHFYKQLDARFPGSKFVFTGRDVDSWLKSCEGYRRFDRSFRASRAVRSLRRQFYQTEFFDAEKFRVAYERHLVGVRRHFSDRPDDIIEINVCAGEGFEKLCPFLGKEPLTARFPHENENLATDESGTGKG